MSITFGIYDFFSYTVPGVLYILVVNRLLFFLKLPSLDINDLSVNIGSSIMWVILAYVTGQLMDNFAIKLYYKVNDFKAERSAVNNFNDKYRKKMKIDFTIHDRKALLSVVRHHNLDLALYIDNFKAVSYMLNNISLALILFSLEQLTEILVDGVSIFRLVVIIASLVFSYVAINRSAIFNEWHWLAVYQHARQYGADIPSMFDSSSKKGPSSRK